MNHRRCYFCAGILGWDPCIFYILGKCSFLIYKNAPRGCALRRTRKMSQAPAAGARVFLKNHSCNLHAPLCGRFCLHSVDVARYAALIQTKSPTNSDRYLAESIFKTHSSACGGRLRHLPCTPQCASSRSVFIY